MTANQTKHLFWHMVLATIVVLAILSNNPTAMDPNTFVSGSSASLRTLVPYQSDAQVKRRLRSTEETMENMDDDTEDRAFPAAESIDNLTKRVFSHVNYNQWNKYLAVKPNPLIGEVIRVNYILQHFDLSEMELLNVIATGKNLPGSKDAAKSLENGLLLKWIHSNYDYKVYNHLQVNTNKLVDLLKDPFWTIWINCLVTDDIYRRIYVMIKWKISDDKTLATQLSLAKNDDATKKLASQLEELLLQEWENAKYTAGNLFDHLELRKHAMENSLWDTWLLYLIECKMKKGLQSLESLVLETLRSRMGDNDINQLIARGKESENEETKKFAESLEKEFQSLKYLSLSLGISSGEKVLERPTKRKRQSED